MKEWLSLTERLHFTEMDGRVFAVMAYSDGDARRQYWDARIREYWNVQLEASIRNYSLWSTAYVTSCKII